MFDTTALLIDGGSLQLAARTLNIAIDFRKLLDICGRRGHLVRAVYFHNGTTGQQSEARPLLDWLAYNGFTVIERGPIDRNGHSASKGSLRVELAVEAMRLATVVDHLILVSGERDFQRLVLAVQRCGVRVTVLHHRSTVGDDLRRKAVEFWDLADLDVAIRS